MQLSSRDRFEEWEQAAVGFEPTNNGFANRRLRPLGYAANVFSDKGLWQSLAKSRLSFCKLWTNLQTIRYKCK